MDTIFWIFITLFVLTLVFSFPRIEWLTNKNYAYDLDRFFLLINNVQKHFDDDGHIPYGTIRLTKDMITLVVLDPKTHQSHMYDIQYNNKTMEITDVTKADMAFAVEATNDIHTLIKKSPIL